MKIKFNLLLLFFLLILPKIPLSFSGERQNQQGILIGECFIFLSILINYKEIIYSIINKHINKTILFFFSIIFFYVLNSSIVSGIYNLLFPSHALFYFFRLSIYLLLPISISILYKHNNTDMFWYGLIKKSYIIHGILSLLVYFYYYFKFLPSFSDSLWTSEVGYRLLPMVGLAFNPSNTDYFYSIGGGSSNLLGTWTVFFTLNVIFFEKKKYVRLFLYSFSFLLLLLSQTRGGLITFVLTLFFSFYIQKKIGSGLMTIFILVIFIFFAIYFSSFEFNNSLPIISRFFDSYKEGSFDGSTAARFENYLDILRIWYSDPVYILFGLGFDENILFDITRWTLVESFYLSILFSGGSISFILFISFGIKLYNQRKRNSWFSILFYFILLNSIINWSITGSDILSVVGLFPIIFLSTIGSLKIS